VRLRALRGLSDSLCDLCETLACSAV
jgi:hypothetical protein